ncbi:MAG TPA: beta-galactosidase GalB [Pyrinomonadaceae bacterium]|jgi:beta-galactosidase|nr:beta-galactosidase GalB [Pyrinomonadaceae bacterium]
MTRKLTLAICCLLFAPLCFANSRPGKKVSFNQDWRFHLGDIANGQDADLNDAQWRQLDLPHDWSIEGEFSEKAPSGTGGGALPGGLGWYRKTFTVPMTAKGKQIFIEFDGVYRNSEVWINGQYLGKRPYGYISFIYELTPHLIYGGGRNVIAVKVDNSQQPNSRWYSGSGIYRNVWLTTLDPVHVEHWGTYVTTPEVNNQSATVVIKTRVSNGSKSATPVNLTTIIQDASGKEVARSIARAVTAKDSHAEVSQTLEVSSPSLWSDDRPYVYKVISQLQQGGRLVDRYETPLGIRSFVFDVNKGFILNGKPVKIRGVCNHHDLGSLGAAVNTRAIERQLEMLKEMGVNGLRTSHNPPAPELLELTDKMGFIVMDEAFDIWKIQKTKFDYHLDFDEWHKRDLEDMLLRDRNHPSIFIWSIGNEVMEQWNDNPEGGRISRMLRAIVRNLDTTRPVTSATNGVNTNNKVITEGELDLIGTNYDIKKIPELQKMFPGRPIIGAETTSALGTRGTYNLPSDKILRWPRKWDEVLKEGNPDFTCSAYDNSSAPWGSTHEETWKIVKKTAFFSGMYIWTGWDYIGEPTPYPWPAVSSYFGIIDLAGFPKDVYYMYQSEWTNKQVLHLFPHWNWKPGQEVDMVTYFNADEVELFLNGRSLGTKRKQGDDVLVFWRIPFEPGVVKAVSRKNGQVVLTKEVRTAEEPARIILAPDRRTIKAEGTDLSFITVKVVDRNGTVVPTADNLIKFKVVGDATIAGVDNGYQASHESFKGKQRKAWHGMALVILQSKQKPGRIYLEASSDNLQSASLVITTR